MINWFKRLSPTFQIALVIVAIVIIFFSVRKIKELLNKPRIAPVNWSNMPVVGTNPETGKGVYWNPDPLAKEIYKNFEGWNLKVYPETAQKILDLQTDDQVKLLYNHYNKNYAKDYPSLTQLIDNEWPDVRGVYKQAVARLKGLGLN